jgi:hypothetical protein
MIAVRPNVEEEFGIWFDMVLIIIYVAFEITPVCIILLIINKKQAATVKAPESLAESMLEGLEQKSMDSFT